MTQAYCAGVLPPDINLPSLSRKARQPNLHEVQAVLDLRHLVLCIECIFWHDFPIGGSWGLSDKDPPSTPLDRGVWKENFHRTFYTYLVVGAYLARAYMEPFHGAIEDSPPKFLHAFEMWHNQISGGYYQNGEWLPDPKILPLESEYLKGFPVYNLDGAEPLDSSYEHLSKWLIQQTETRILEIPAGDPKSKHQYYDANLEQVQIREVLQIIFIHYQMARSMGHLGMKFVSNSNGQMGYSRHRNPKPESIRPFDKTRKVTVIFFGIFQPETISTPAVIPYSDAAPDSLGIPLVRLHAESIPRAKPGPQLPDIAMVLSAMSDDLHMEQPLVSYYISPLIFVSYIFKKHFGLKFGDEAFNYPHPDQPPYNLMRTNGEIFYKEYFCGYQNALLENIDSSVDLNG